MMTSSRKRLVTSITRSCDYVFTATTDVNKETTEKEEKKLKQFFWPIEVSQHVPMTSISTQKNFGGKGHLPSSSTVLRNRPHKLLCLWITLVMKITPMFQFAPLQKYKCHRPGWYTKIITRTCSFICRCVKVEQKFIGASINYLKKKIFYNIYGQPQIKKFSFDTPTNQS